jgi:hypothetical protein
MRIQARITQTQPQDLSDRLSSMASRQLAASQGLPPRSGKVSDAPGKTGQSAPGDAASKQPSLGLSSMFSQDTFTAAPKAKPAVALRG